MSSLELTRSELPTVPYLLNSVEAFMDEKHLNKCYPRFFKAEQSAILKSEKVTFYPRELLQARSDINLRTLAIGNSRVDSILHSITCGI